MKTGTATEDLKVGDIVRLTTKAQTEISVVDIVRRNGKRVTWRITWSNGERFTYGVNSRFNVIGNCRRGD